MTEIPSAPDPSLPPPGGLPPPAPSAAGPHGDEKTMVIVVYVLHLAGFLTAGVTNLIGVIMSYVLKSEASAWGRSHYDFQIRTFWIALVASLIAWSLFALFVVLIIIVIGIPLLVADSFFLLAIFIWFMVRCVVGLINAAEGRPYPRPQSWMV